MSEKPLRYRATRKKIILKTFIKTYAMTNPIINRLALLILLPLAAGIMEMVAWGIFEDGDVGFATFFAILGAFLFLLIFPLYRVFYTVIELKSDGVGLSGKGLSPVFLKWGQISRIKEGMVYPKGWLMPGLALFDSVKKLKILIPYAIQNYDELREKVLEEWKKRKIPPRFPLVIKRFPFFRLEIDIDGVRLRRWFKVICIPVNEISVTQFGFYYLFRKTVRFSEFYEITLKNGRSFKIYGWFLSLPEIDWAINKILSHKPRVVGPVGISEEKLSNSLWRFGFVGVLWGGLPSFYFGKILFSPIPRVLALGGFLFLLLTLYGLTFRAFMRKGLVTHDPVPPKTYFSVLAAVVLPLLVLVVSDYSTRSIFRFAGQRMMEEVKQEARVAGYKMELPSNLPKLKDEENAVYFLKKAIDIKSAKFLIYSDKNNPDYRKSFYKNKTQIDFLSDFQKDMLAGNLTAEEMGFARKLIQTHTETLQLIEKAYRKQKVDWGLDFTVPYYRVEVPHMSGYLNWSRLLVCRAFFEARAGQQSQALASLKTALFLGDASRQSRTLIGQMINVAIYKLVLDKAPLILNKIDPRLVEKEFFPALKSEELIQDLLEALRYESFGHGEWGETMNFSLINRTFAEWSQASYYKGQIHKFNTLALPYSERSKAFEKAQEEAKRSRWFFYLDNSISEIQFFDKALEAVAYCRLARVGTEARLFREKNKRWPDAVWELKEKKLDDHKDPFTDGIICE